jgi:biotin synthase-like enzyme
VYCLKVLALFRFINPSKEIRISGGREVNLRSLQPLGDDPLFHAALLSLSNLRRKSNLRHKVPAAAANEG